MLNDYSAIRHKTITANGLEEKLRALEGAGENASAIVLSAGPSLKRYSKTDLERLCSDKIVICVKQAFDVCPVPCHFHLLNPWNYKKYDYGEHKPLVVFESRGANEPPTTGLCADLHFPVSKNAETQDWLAKTRDFDEHLFTKTLTRPWGPGILYELGFYLIIHLHIKNALILGWDLSMDSRGTVTHFYESRYEKIVKRLRGYLQSRERNQQQNATTIGEFDEVAKSTCDLNTWMTAKGTEILLPSENVVACGNIPRVKLLA